MKKTDFRVMNNQDVELEYDGKAIAFIKSRMVEQMRILIVDLLQISARHWIRLVQ